MLLIVRNCGQHEPVVQIGVQVFRFFVHQCKFFWSFSHRHTHRPNVSFSSYVRFMAIAARRNVQPKTATKKAFYLHFLRYDALNSSTENEITRYMYIVQQNGLFTVQSSEMCHQPEHMLLPLVCLQLTFCFTCKTNQKNSGVAHHLYVCICCSQSIFIPRFNCRFIDSKYRFSTFQIVIFSLRLLHILCIACWTYNIEMNIRTLVNMRILCMSTNT